MNQLSEQPKRSQTWVVVQQRGSGVYFGFGAVI